MGAKKAKDYVPAHTQMEEVARDTTLEWARKHFPYLFEIATPLDMEYY